MTPDDRKEYVLAEGSGTVYVHKKGARLGTREYNESRLAITQDVLQTVSTLYQKGKPINTASHFKTKEHIPAGLTLQQKIKADMAPFKEDIGLAIVQHEHAPTHRWSGERFEYELVSVTINNLTTDVRANVSGSIGYKYGPLI